MIESRLADFTFDCDRDMGLQFIYFCDEFCLYVLMLTEMGKIDNYKIFGLLLFNGDVY